MLQKIIYSEQLHVAIEPSEIVTVLGSCVAVCLHDRKKSIIGMNHYLLPLWSGNGLKSLRYGNISIDRLIESMLNQGSSLQNIEAKIFGGAMLNINEETSVAPRNIQVAIDMLKVHRIPIVASDVGGDKGRKIFFSSIDGAVYVKYSK